MQKLTSVILFAVAYWAVYATVSASTYNRPTASNVELQPNISYNIQFEENLCINKKFQRKELKNGLIIQ